MKIRKILFTLFFVLVGCQSNHEVIITPSIQKSDDMGIVPTVTLPTATDENDEISDSFVSEDDFVQLAWFYKPPEDGTSISELAQFFDVFVLTHYDEEVRDELRTLGKAPFFEYLAFTEIQDPGSCEKKPYGNQVAYKIGDFCKISIEHPDWFLRDKNGQVIREGRNVFMDPDNVEYREFWLTRTKELREEFGWDGIFIDNLDTDLSRFDKLGSLPEKYPNDKSYQLAVEEFLAYVHGYYFNMENIPLYANIIEYEDEKIWLHYLNYLDGVMVEAFAVGYNEHYYSAFGWKNQLMMISEAQARGKSVILVSQGRENNIDREKFTFASYLLVNDGEASFCYTDSEHYEEVWLYENYFYSLGSPKNKLYQVAGGWRRDFTNGYAFVNPRLHIGEIYLNE